MRPAPRRGPLPSTRSRVLQASDSIALVGDDPGTRDVIRFVLEDAGLQVEALTSCSEALLALRVGLRPGLMLVDLRRPDLHPDELAVHARRLPGLAELPILVTSERRSAPCPIGITSFLLKPFRAEELLESIHAHGVVAQPRSG